MAGPGNRSDAISPGLLSEELKTEAIRLGFDGCGISRAEPLTDEARRLEEWLGAGQHGSMSWMARNVEKRTDPGQLVPGARSVISVLQNYYHETELSDDPQLGRISRYALGDDYHDVMKARLRRLFSWLETRVGHVDGRVFVDSAPVMDKVWAAKAGLGWMGKHTNLINTDLGSWFFIGEMIVDTLLEPDSPVPDMCGSCTRCIDACPTDAISEPYVVDGSRCISYLTIENRDDQIDADLAPDLGNWIFGCDVCQDVCPWNKFRKPSNEPAYAPRSGFVDRPLHEWAELDEEEFRSLFRKNPVKRTKWSGFRRNVRTAQANAGLIEQPDRAGSGTPADEE